MTKEVEKRGAENKLISPHFNFEMTDSLAFDPLLHFGVKWSTVKTFLAKKCLSLFSLLFDPPKERHELLMLMKPFAQMPLKPTT